MTVQNEVADLAAKVKAGALENRAAERRLYGPQQSWYVLDRSL